MVKKSMALSFALTIVVSGVWSCGPAPTPGPTLTPLSLQAPGWQAVTVHTLCLKVEQSYPDIEGKEPEPIAEAAQRILTGMAMKVLPEGALCDATLTVTLSGRALGANYIGAGYCYSAAEVDGQMLLTVRGREAFTLPIREHHPPPYTIPGCPKEAIEAPFQEAWPKALFDGLADLWGRAQVLIQGLGDEDEYVRFYAGWALAEITRQHFGDDARGWQEWWEEQE